MGRRTLRNPNAALDLSAHLREEAELPAPLDPRSLFAQPGPLEIEVGSGKGLFLCSASVQTPQHNFLGIELARKYAHYTAGRLAAARRVNALMIAGDAVRIFHERLTDETAAAVHVYFPDPWWKKRHRKRRVMNELLLHGIQRVLLPGGVLHFWTDVEEYFHSALDLLARETTLTGPLEVPETPASGPLDYRTHFERRTRLTGQPVFRAQFRKPAPPDQEIIDNARPTSPE